MESIVSLNLKDIVNNVTINDYPILFYWDNASNEDGYINILKESPDFLDYIKHNIMNNSNECLYINTKIYICYYNGETDSNIEREISLQEIFKLEYLDDFYLNYVCKYFKSLYDTSFKNEPIKYDKHDVGLLLFIYRKLRSKYSINRINPSVIINYVLSKIAEDYTTMTADNYMFIKDKLTEIIKK